jgi:hypothetical protein
MFNLIHESGWGGWFTLILSVAGLAAVTTVGRWRGRPGSVGAAWAVAVLAAGALGFATGQRACDRGLTSVMHSHPPEGGAEAHPPADPGHAVLMLSHGTREASGNLILAGAGALIISLVGGTLALVRKEPKA